MEEIRWMPFVFSTWLIRIIVALEFGYAFEQRTSGPTLTLSPFLA